MSLLSLCGTTPPYASISTTGAVLLLRRDSPFVPENNAGSGFGELALWYTTLHAQSGCCAETAMPCLHERCSVSRVCCSAAVGDGDLCLLNTMVYESPSSSGSSCQGGIYNSDEGTCVPLPPYAIRSGPRHDIYFDPDKVSCPLPGASSIPQGLGIRCQQQN